MTSGRPFDDIRALIRQMPSGDDASANRAEVAFLGSAGGKLERLQQMAIWLSRWSGRPPAILRPLVAVFGGAHGVARHLDARPAERPSRYVESAAAGALPLNHLCKAYDLGLQVYDLALDVPTADMTIEAALDEKSCAATMAFGMEAVAGGIDLLCVGSFGTGDTLVADAVLAAMAGSGRLPEQRDETEPAGSENRSRRTLVDAALAVHQAQLADPLELLRCLGGREFAALAGAIVAARTQRVPVILEGVAALAVGAILQKLRSDAIDHCILSSLPQSDTAFAFALICKLEPVLGRSFSAEAGIDCAIAASILKGAASSAPPLPVLLDPSSPPRHT